MALSYGTTGLKQKNWRVYIAPADTANLDVYLDYVVTNKNTDAVEDAIYDMPELGECRNDSISVTGEDGESIDGNVAGNIVINKNCTMTAELINFTPANIEALEALDGTAVSVMLVEKDSHIDNDIEDKTVVIIRNKNLSYSENITGGDTGRGTITLASTPRKVTGFREIVDCRVTG